MNAQERATEVIDRIHSANTIEELRTALAAMTRVEKLADIGQFGSRRPGVYFDGVIIVAIGDGDTEAVQDDYATSIQELPEPTKMLMMNLGAADAVTRRRGRPSIGEKIQVRLSAVELTGLDNYAEARGWSRAAAIRDLVRKGLRDQLA